MANHRRDEQDHDDGWQQPNRAENQISREREINPADREKRKERLPAWLWFIDVVMLFGHGLVLAENLGDQKRKVDRSLRGRC